MSANGTTVTSIDRRPLLDCSCGCGQQATLPHLRVISTEKGTMLILPGCIPAYEERAASQKQLREIVTQGIAIAQGAIVRADKQRTFLGRLRYVGVVYRLQRFIFSRNGARAARRTALRSATVYLVGRRLGLLVSMCWRKS